MFSSRRISPTHSRYLDAWRGCSAIAVFVGHLGQIFVLNSSPAWDALGTGAVMVFFVISGFFIRKSLEKGGDFLAARVNRIGVPFASAIVLTVALWFIAPLVFVTGNRSFVIPTTQQAYTLKHVLPTVLMVSWCIGGTIPANIPLWSLAYEVFYYVLVAFRNVRIALLGLIAASIINPAVGLLGLVWFAGFWVAKLHSEDRLPRWPQWPFLMPMSLAAYFMMTMRGSIALWWQVAVGLAFVAHLISVLRRVPPDPGPMARSADWSYTLYVMHYPLLLFAYGTGLPMLPSASAVLILVVVIGRRIEQIKIIKSAALAPKNSLA